MLYHVDNLELSHTLGEGAFGQVRKGVLTKDKGTTVDVAVKMLKGAIISRIHLCVFVTHVVQTITHVLVFY